MPLTRVSPSLIAVANNVTSNVFGSANTIPSLTFDASGVISTASNTAIQINTADIVNGAVTDAKITAVANTKITGLITSGQIANVANTQITGLITQAQIATGVAGTGPAFSAYPAAAATITNVTATLAQCNTKSGDSQLFDTGGCFNNTGSSTTLNGITAPAYSFTPNIAGYYLIGVYGVSNGTGTMQPSIYFNGNAVNQVAYSASSDYRGGSNQILTYLNGTGDYVQYYFFQSSGGSITTLASRPDIYKFYGFMIRSA